MEFLQQLANGLSLGAIYALIALGYTMIYGVLRFVNFAHGDVFMLSPFIGMYLVREIKPEGTPIWLPFVVFAVAMTACAIIGMVIEKLAYRPLRGRPRLTVLITAIGVSLFLEFGCQAWFGATPQAFPRIMAQQTFHFGGIVISSNRLLALGVTVLLLIALTLIIQKTKIGMAMRAVAFQPAAASLMGINNDRVISFTFALGSALAGAGGILWAMNFPSIDPLMGILPGLKAFVAAVLGGIGNIPGAAIGGLILGLLETFAGGSQFSGYKDGIAFAILIVILLLRPGGLLGKAEVEKV